MAKVVEDFEFRTNSLRSKYPWDVWLDGQTWQLVKDEDYVVSNEAIQSIARNRGKDKGLKVMTGIRGNSVYIKAVADDGSTIHQPQEVHRIVKGDK